MNDYPEIKARFEAETKQHVMTILHDDGLYRHLRFMNPKDSAYWFEIVTWPGSLVLRGDLNDAYTFTRLTDMFEFFRGKRINPHYWAEKLGGRRQQVKEFSEDVFRQTVKDHVANDIRFGDAPRGIGKAVREQILDAEVYDRESAIELLEAFDFEGYEFGETWEWNLTDYDWSYVWCCYALVWAIAQYDASKASTAETCGSRCPVHEHVCQRSPHPLPSELDIKSPGAWDPHCRNQANKTADCCTWDRERNGLLVGHGGQLEILRAAVARDGGEWTPGRVKRLFHRDARLTHVLRVTIRRHLARLHAEGFLTLHEEPGRRFYTRTEAAR